MDRWADANWTYLRGEMARVMAALDRAVADHPVTTDAPTAIPLELIERAPAIVAIGRSFGLSAFERDVVLACAAAELDPDFAKRTGMSRVVLRLALNAFAGGDPMVLGSSRPLRAHRLVTPLDGAPLFGAPLLLDEGVLQAIVGGTTLDGRLAAIVRELPVTDIRHEAIDRIIAARTHAPQVLLVGLIGSSEGDRQAVAAAAGAALNLRVYRLRAADLPLDAVGRNLLRERWECERRMHPFALLVELARESSPELVRSATALLDDLGGLAFVSSHEAVAVSNASYAAIEIGAAPREQRLERLKRALGPHDAELALPSQHLVLRGAC